MSKLLDRLLEMDAGDLVKAIQTKDLSYREIALRTNVTASSCTHYTREGEGRRKASDKDWRALAKLAIELKVV